MADFSPEIAGLTGDVPVALLPVRIEARFFDGGTELRVRIFPDQIHIDAHEPELTAAELKAGKAYWRGRIAGEEAAWETLCAAVRGPARAAWVSQALEPTNLGRPGDPHFPPGEKRPATWSKAAVATALPERWVVVGWRDGAEVFRVWTKPVADGLDVTLAPLDDTTQVADGELPLQPSARWLVDFDEAERVGMAVRVTSGQLALGLDRLFVLGVDWTLHPDTAAETIGDLLAAHVYTDGLEALTPGTPTNVTAAARPGAPPAADTLAAALDPQHRPTAQAVEGTGGDRLWRALGLDSGGLLSALPGTGGREQELVSHLVNALWESTLGLYLADFMNPNLTDAAAAQVREHARRHLFPGGPFPALRIGRQPYGVLPVVAPGRFTPDGSLEAQLAAVLGRLRPHWDAGVSSAPHLGRTADLDADLTAVLQTTPQAATLRYRNVVGPLTIAATLGLEHHAAAQGLVTDLVGTRLGWPQRPFVARCGTQPADHPLRVPLVDPVALEPGAGLSRNYLQEIVQLARTSGTYEAIQAREDADTLLEALVAHAVARELHRADLRVIDLHLLAAGQITEMARISVSQTAEFVGIEATGRPPGAPGALVTTPFEAARLKLGGQKTVRQSVTELIRPGAGLPVRFPELAGALASLEWLSARPAEELDRGFRGLLDAYAYRLDAWLTSLATRRLGSVRSVRPDGVHLGGYGWVDDLRPDAGAPTSEGFVHAPSLPQAATAAVLRSGRLAHRDAEHAALDIDLRSDRVRLALGLLEGVSAGQPLAALLGYRFERALREHSLLLAKFILPLRRMFPLRTDGDGNGSGPVEAIAARDVVDGVALLERWRTQRDAVLNPLSPPAGDRQGLTVELDRLADVYDAVADVMLAEAVHQSVLGNNERAGAVLAAVDRQGLPPRMDFVRTPRTGRTFAHRVLVLAGDDAVPAAWVNDARAAAEPRLNAWIAQIVGAPGRVRFAATATGVAQQLTATLSELQLSPLALVMAAHAAGYGEPSELEERLVALFAGKLTAPAQETELALLDAPPTDSGPEVVGLGALRALLRRIYELITDTRPANATDLALPAEAGETGVDDAEVKARADALATAYGQAITRLADANTAAALRTALWRAVGLGVEAAVPPLEPLDGCDDRAELKAQADDVVARMRSAVDAAAALPAGTSAPERVAQHSGRIRTMLGEHFPVLPRFSVTNAAQLRAPRAELLAGDRLAPSAWLGRISLVRDGVERLARVRHAAELLQGNVRPDDLLVAQFPHRAGERWLALESPAGGPAEAELSVVAHTSGAVEFGKPLAGLFCDGWAETIPDREETTGIAFHHDAPGARPPQAVLLAVPPAASNPAWSVDALLDTIVEAHDLARIRAVGPRQLDWLGTVLPMLYLPEAFSKDVPTIDLGGLVRKYDAANAATATILGKG